jgi:hypothetical protein
MKLFNIIYNEKNFFNNVKPDYGITNDNELFVRS